jgi:hypothetical protein
MDARKLAVLIPAVGAILSSCEPQVYCTQEFRMFDAVVLGPVPTEVYTVDQTTGDTLRDQHNGGYPAALYGVGSDGLIQYQGYNSTRSYLFVVERTGQTPCVTPFVFQADACHISKVSGPDTVVCP